MTAGPAGGFNIGHILSLLTGADQFGGGFTGGLRGIGHSMMQHYRDANGIVTPAAAATLDGKATPPMLDAKTLMENYFAGKAKPAPAAPDLSAMPMGQVVKNFAPPQIAGTPWGQGSWSGPRQ